MRAKVLIGLSVAVVAAILLTVVAVAGGSTTLPALTPAELLAKMAGAAGQTQSISGEVSWTNDLLGAGTLSQFQSGSAQSPLTGSGTGRVWLSPAGLRLESQSSAGDQVTVVSTADKTAWVYDSAGNSVKKYLVTGASTASPVPSPSPSMLTPSQMDQIIQKAASVATVTAGGQATVAGQEAYLLRLTPAAKDTALGSIEVAVDGKTFVPLRLQVFAASASSPTLSFGFDSVSYGAIDPSMFTFTPPAGATVTTKQIDSANLHNGQAAKDADGTDTEGVGDKDAEAALQGAKLTVDQAQRLVDFQLAAAQGYSARPFAWAAVVDKGQPLTAAGTPLAQLFGGAGMQTGSGQTQPVTGGPVAALVYGKSFGTIVLVESKTTSQLDAQLSKLPQIGQSVSVGGHQAKMLSTPLGGAIVWQDGGRTMAAFGMVTGQDLQAFAAAVH